MADICMYFQVHQPYRLARYRLFDIGSDRSGFDAERNWTILDRVARKCYVPTNRILAGLAAEADADFRFAISLSGTLLEQLAEHAPTVLDSFGALVDTGRAEVLAETYYHSLASLVHREEFARQVRMHSAAVQERFGIRPTVFRNTELIFRDDLAETVVDLGFRAALVEGADHVLGWRSPNHVYQSAVRADLRLLPRNFDLSDDIGFRFSNRDWRGWPLTADRYARWVADSPGDCVNVFIDYETFGEHQWEETGIFEFLRHLPAACARAGVRFVQPSELADRAPVGALRFEHATSWADVERDVTAWLGNRMQQGAHERLYALRDRVISSGDDGLIERWRRLTTSDHFYYMCTKWFADGDVHKYFNPFPTPYDAFVAYANVLQDLEQRLPARPGSDDAPGSADGRPPRRVLASHDTASGAVHA